MKKTFASNAVLVTLLVVQGVLSSACFVLTLEHIFVLATSSLVDSASLWLLVVCACLVPQIVLSVFAPRLGSPTPGRELILGYALVSALAVCGFYLFFHGPAHDIGLLFGIHGRFGCAAIDEVGRRTTWLDDRTLPWLHSVPIPMAYLSWTVLRMRFRGDGAQLAQCDQARLVQEK